MHLLYNNHLARRVLLGVLLGTGLNSAWALTSDKEQPIHIEADRVDLDDKRGVGVYQGQVRFTQGSVLFTADKLTVHTIPVGQPRAREIDHVVAEGAPTRFRQLLDSRREELRGEAQRMEFYGEDERAVFEGNAHVWKGGDEFTGNRIEYDMRAETVKAHKGANDSGRVHVVIQPRAKSPPAPSSTPSPPASPSRP